MELLLLGWRQISYWQPRSSREAQTDPGLCLSAPKLPPWVSPMGKEQKARRLRGVPMCFSPCPSATGAPSSWNGGAQGLLSCLQTSVHTATAPSMAAHTSGWSTELGMPWTPLYFWLKQKGSASRQTLSFYSAHPGYLTLPWRSFGLLYYWYLNRTLHSELLVEVP